MPEVYGRAVGDAGPHRYFLVDEAPPLLVETARRGLRGTVVDLGAGDGSLIWALERGGLLGGETVAVDLSRERVALCESLSPRVRGVVADATRVEELPDGCADGVIASQLIEHLPDDRALAPEIARLLRPGGWFYVSSVLKGPRSFWIYRRDGAWRTDPTHVREYASVADFRAAVEHPLLELGETRSHPLWFPALDLAVRAAALARVLPFEAIPRLYVERPALARRLRRLRVPVPGYGWVEVAGTRG